MFSLVNGKPQFYIGEVNGMGYTSEEEKKTIIRELGDVEIEDKPVKVDEDLKEEAIRLGELQLTYSKSEFMKYLSGEKSIPELEMIKLEKENEKLEEDLSIMQQSVINLQKQMILGGMKNE